MMFGFALLIVVGLVVFAAVGAMTAFLCVPRLRSPLGCVGAVVLGGGAGALVFLALVTLFGALTDRHFGSRVSEAQVVGTWSMTGESRAHFVRDNLLTDLESPCFIEFRADGTCTFDSLERPSSFGWPRSARISAQGSWRLVHDEVGDSSRRVKNLLELTLRPQGGGLFFNLYFTRGDSGASAVHLWTYYTDPDMGQYIEYTRKP